MMQNRDTERDDSASCGGAVACWEDISISAFLSRALETALGRWGIIPRVRGRDCGQALGPVCLGSSSDLIPPYSDTSLSLLSLM